MKAETLYVVLADGWYVGKRGVEFIATPDKSEAKKVNLIEANHLFNQLQSAGNNAAIEFAEDVP